MYQKQGFGGYLVADVTFDVRRTCIRARRWPCLRPRAPDSVSVPVRAPVRPMDVDENGGRRIVMTCFLPSPKWISHGSPFRSASGCFLSSICGRPQDRALWFHVATLSIRRLSLETSIPRSTAIKPGGRPILFPSARRLQARKKPNRWNSESDSFELPMSSLRGQQRLGARVPSPLNGAVGLGHPKRNPIRTGLVPSWPAPPKRVGKHDDTVEGHAGSRRARLIGRCCDLDIYQFTLLKITESRIYAPTFCSGSITCVPTDYRVG